MHSRIFNKGKFEFDIDKPLDKSDTLGKIIFMGLSRNKKHVIINYGFKCFITVITNRSRYKFRLRCHVVFQKG